MFSPEEEEKYCAERVSQFIEQVETRVFKSDLEKIIWLETAYAWLAAGSIEEMCELAIAHADEKILNKEI